MSVKNSAEKMANSPYCMLFAGNIVLVRDLAVKLSADIEILACAFKKEAFEQIQE